MIDMLRASLPHEEGVGMQMCIYVRWGFGLLMHF